MAKRTVSKSKESQKLKQSKKKKATTEAVTRKPVKNKKATAPTSKAASTTKKAAAKRAARLKAIEAARVAETTAATTINYAPAPFETVADHDPSKAPGKQHRHPPQSLHGVKHSEAYIAKARTSFNRRMNIGR